jgi:hypothetical protein
LKAGSAKARAAGRKAAATRRRNARLGKTSHKRTPRKGKSAKRRAQAIKNFGGYKVNKDALIEKLNASKQKSFKPTEIVSLTWKVIKGQK